LEVSEYNFGSIKPEEYYINKKESQKYEFGDTDFEKFICGNTKMIFYSNPKGGLPPNAVNRSLYETEITLECTTFDMKNT